MEMTDRAVVEKYRHITTKEYMTLNEALALSRRLAADHAGNGYDLVIGVPNGGLLPTKVVSDALGIPFRLVTVRRKGSAIKGRLSRYRWVKRLVARWYETPVLNIPLEAVMQYMSGLADSDGEDEQIHDLTAFSRILVVDDSLESGQSLRRVVEIVSRQAATGAQIDTAVLCVGQAVPEEKRLYRVDYRLCDLMQHFPWSTNNPDYDSYQQWLADHDLLRYQKI